MRAWQAGNDRLLPNALRDYVSIDLELLPVEPVTGGLQAVTMETMEQRATVEDGTGHTVTVTAATLRFPEVHDELCGIATRVQLDTGKGRP